MSLTSVSHSPYHFDADQPDELFVPAVNGTVGVLNSLKKNKWVAPRTENQANS
jgi:hypothetical protein